jgi:hypothetical protein
MEVVSLSCCCKSVMRYDCPKQAESDSDTMVKRVCYDGPGADGSLLPSYICSLQVRLRWYMYVCLDYECRVTLWLSFWVSDEQDVRWYCRKRGGRDDIDGPISDILRWDFEYEMDNGWKTDTQLRNYWLRRLFKIELEDISDSEEIRLDNDRWNVDDWIDDWQWMVGSPIFFVPRSSRTSHVA